MRYRLVALLAELTLIAGPPQAPPLAQKPAQAPPIASQAGLPPAPAGFAWERDVRGPDGKIHPWGLRQVAVRTASSYHPAAPEVAAQRPFGPGSGTIPSTGVRPVVVLSSPSRAGFPTGGTPTPVPGVLRYGLTSPGCPNGACPLGR